MNYRPAEHQQLGIDHLTTHDRALLFAEMGTGKTGMVLAALRHLFADMATTGALVVAPLRVATLQWPSEVVKFQEFSWLVVADLRTAEGWRLLERSAAHLYVINYEMLPKLADRYCYNRRGPFAFDSVIFDEITKAKNAKSKRIRAIRPYLPKMTRRWGLTGTPTPNGYLDLFAQVGLIDDGQRLGRSLTSYKETWFDSDFMGYKLTLKADAERRIRERIADITLTLRAEDWLDVPATHVEEVEVSLPAEAKRFYGELEKELLALLKNGAEVVAANAAVLMNKLLQVVGGSIYDEERTTHHLHSAKLDALRKLVLRVGEPVMIACVFRHERERIMAAVPGCVEWSDAVLDRWNAGEVKAIVAHPASIGHGLNLWRGGRTVIWYSRNWQRELYDQMNGRFVGARAALSGRTPQVFHLITPGTVDDAVDEALRQKAEGQAGLMAALAALKKIAK
jgi:SNF2 family DNA or RNA helicase